MSAVLLAALLAFDRSPADMASRCARARDRASMRLAEVATLSAPSRTFANTPEALEGALAELREQTASERLLARVAVSSAARDAGADCDRLVRGFEAAAAGRADLERALEEYAASKPALEGEAARLLEDERREARRAGAALRWPDDSRLHELRRRERELEADLWTKADQDRSSILVSSAELAGLSDDYAARLERDGGRYRVGLSRHELEPFMENARDGAARRRLQELLERRAAAEDPLLSRLLDARRQAASVLGYDSRADYELEPRLARGAADAGGVLERAAAAARSEARRELDELLRLKDEDLGGRSDRKLHAWDWPYYEKRLASERAVDEAELAEYFPLETTLAAALALFGRWLGVELKRVDAPAPAWHPDVRLYSIESPGEGALAYLYIDPFARDGKEPGAFTAAVVDGRRLPDGGYQRPVAAITLGLARPTPGRPALLAHADVEALLGQLARAAQHALSRARYARFSGSRAAPELADGWALAAERWALEPRVLEALSSRYDEPERRIPRRLVERLRDARTLGRASRLLRAELLADVELALNGPSATAPEKAWRRARRRAGFEALGARQPGTGVEVSRYGRLWAEELAEDLSRRGPFDAVAGGVFRREILEPAGARDPRDSLRRLLGH